MTVGKIRSTVLTTAVGLFVLLLAAAPIGPADAVGATDAAGSAGSAGSAGAAGGPGVVGEVGAASPRMPSNRSGLRWASGAFMNEQAPGMHNAFGRWRKAKTDLALTYTGRSTWTDIVNPAWLYASWVNAPQTLVLSSAPFPEQSQYSLAACSRGAYDHHWRRFGTNIARSGMASRTVVRLAWEFNGDWQQWAARRPADFIGCWRHIYRAAESRAPRLRWDWTVNRGSSEGVMTDPRKAWPGRKYVDIVGIDSYDGWPPVLDRTGWNAQYAGAYGLKFWADFARRKHKRLSVPEWGLFRGSAWAGHSGGDNPYYITKMFGFFKEQRGNLAYEAYFNDEEPEHLTALSVNPRGAAEYRRQIALARARR